MYLNKVMLIGNLTRDPEMKAIPSGAKVTTFSLATTRTWKGTDGTRQEQEGQKKYRTEIVVDNFQFGPKAGGGAVPGNSGASSAPSAKASKDDESSALDTIEYPEEESNPEDIPF